MSACVVSTSTSRSPAPSDWRALTSCISTPATRPATVWNDWFASRWFVARTRLAIVSSIFSAISGLPASSRRTSPASSATAAVASSACALAERTSPPNIDSSPNMSPARSSARAIVRPPCSRVIFTAPERTTKQVSPSSPSRKMTCPAS
jgi:hypothetical protein